MAQCEQAIYTSLSKPRFPAIQSLTRTIPYLPLKSIKAAIPSHPKPYPAVGLAGSGSLSKPRFPAIQSRSGRFSRSSDKSIKAAIPSHPKPVRVCMSARVVSLSKPRFPAIQSESSLRSGNRLSLSKPRFPAIQSPARRATLQPWKSIKAAIPSHPKPPEVVQSVQAKVYQSRDSQPSKAPCQPCLSAAISLSKPRFPAIQSVGVGGFQSG